MRLIAGVIIEVEFFVPLTEAQHTPAMLLVSARALTAPERKELNRARSAQSKHRFQGARQPIIEHATDVKVRRAVHLGRMRARRGAQTRQPMFIKDKRVEAAREEAAEAEISKSQRATGASGDEMRVRLEGAPWWSLRDRCGVAPRRANSAGTQSPEAEGRGAHPAGPAPAPRAYSRSARAGGRANWRSLSRVEVAMVLVLGALLATVFQGALESTGGNSLFALAASDDTALSVTTPVAPVSNLE
jgi:hypothetical protein